VVNANSSGLSGVRVAASKLVGPQGAIIPSADLTIYREAYYTVTVPSDAEGGNGQWPDALIPKIDPYYHEQRNAFPVTVPPDRNRIAWIDVLVPKKQEAGDYAGTIKVSADGGLAAVLQVRLTVLNFTLPSTASMRSGFGLDYGTICQAHFGDSTCGGSVNEERGWALESLYVRAALEDRVTIYHPAFQPPTTNPRVQWFNQYVLPFLQGTSPQNDAGTWTPVRLPGAKLTSMSSHRSTSSFPLVTRSV